ncbi:MAG: hypothetical protein JWP11_195 [Frankiales bacterium]|nr:hypothetical protein [Frankiales bacterium]
MTTAPMSGPALTSGPGRVARTLVLPVVLGAGAIAVAAVVGHALVGVLLTVGLALGAVNGLLQERAAARLQPTDDRSVIIGGSMRRLGLITVVALVIAVLARPLGWIVFIGLAIYQLLTLAAALGVAAKEARTG